MAGSSRAVKAADAGCGFSCTSLPKDYRLILPPLPSGEGLRRTLVLHCDIAGRPYGINDFRKPLKDLGIIQQVSGIGAYQMSHVWLLNIKTDEAKKTLLDAGLLSVKDRPCLVVDPVRQEVRLKLHWVAFDVNAETIRRALREYGEVREVISDKWRDEDFEGVESTTRFVRLLLREGVTTDRIPHQMRLGSGTALVVVPGRPPLCLRCRNTGHIRRDCRVPRCAGCRAFGHEQTDCARSYASAAGRGTTTDQSEMLMDEEEAERAAASEVSAEASDATVDSESKEEKTKEAAKETTETGTPAQQFSTQADTSERLQVKEITTDASVDMVTTETTPAKRRLLEGDAASQQRLSQEKEGQWRVAAAKKPRGAGRLRSSSLSRGDDGSTP
ncbi:uncharacterized protein LOC125759506 [Rhipicephalus sanguineus]|uniref:uncharacterized protein LOC125759506 n=1 Tax=Rhipicephalus sanguineus TaxID=34632 RepID=UPI0020C30C42|nr:uncharacterized protein LOC125759506 [Rhipicephalus sanguineus]